MAVSIYKNGAWIEPTMKRYEDGEWVDCQFVKKYKDGAWVEIWSSKKLSLFATNLGYGAVYTLSSSTDKKTLTYSLTGTGATNNSVVLAVYNLNGFGNNVNIRYTLKQTVGLGGTYWMGEDYVTILINNSGNITSSTTYNNTVSVNNPKVLYLLIDVVPNYTINGVISDVYINGELILFSI